MRREERGATRDGRLVYTPHWGARTPLREGCSGLWVEGARRRGARSQTEDRTRRKCVQSVPSHQRGHL